MARGGKREGAGRPAGAVNKATDDLKALAREYTAEALEALVSVVRESDSDAAKVSAANAILDRGYGKPSQVLSGDAQNPVAMVHKIMLEGVAPSAGEG